MNVFDSAILGAVQGVTEFLPISSSGHLIIIEKLFGLSVESLKVFDVSLHVGTLMAILVYFWRDVWEMVRFKNPKLILYIVIGSVPAVLIGLFFGEGIDSHFRNTSSVGITLAVVGLFFIFAEYVHKKVAEKGVGWGSAIVIGLFQACALVPGVSRSGSTISGGLMLGLTREKAARFSFLLGIPAIAGAALLTSMKGLDDGAFSGEIILPMIVGFLISFLVGLGSVYILMKFLKKHSLMVFAWYRILVGVGIALIL